MRTVGQLMTKNLHTVSHSVPLGVCMQIMQEHSFHHLPVVDEHGKAIGVVSDYAVLRSCREGDFGDWVCEVTQPSLAPAAPDDLVVPILARQLRDHRDHTLVVDDEGRPLGIFTNRDGLSLARLCLTPWAKVGEVMTAGDLWAVSSQDKADASLKYMFQHDVRHLLVLDDDVLRGVLSHRDLVGLGPMKVSSLVRDPVYTARADTPLESAVALMARHGVGCLPVIDAHRKPEGVLTRTDVLRALTRQLLQSSTPPPASPAP